MKSYLFQPKRHKTIRCWRCGKDFVALTPVARYCVLCYYPARQERMKHQKVELAITTNHPL